MVPLTRIQDLPLEGTLVNGAITVKNKKVFKVGLAGIGKQDTRLLHSVFRISTTRERSYDAVEIADNSHFDILVVAANDEPITANLRSSYYKVGQKPKVPIVVVGNDKPSDSNLYHMPVPLRATRVLRLLDELTIKELNFIPELEIGNENASSKLVEETLVKILPQQSDDAQETRMLVVDDSEPVRKQLEIQLNLLQVSTDLAETAEQAMEMIKQRRYACIFLDVVLPGADGYTVCKAVKKDSRLKHTPVIMLTSKSSPFDRVKGKLAGCNAYLTKPVDRENFTRIIQPYLGLSVAALM